MIKQCGSCEFWDRENASYPVFGRLHTIAPCKNYWNSQAYHEGKDIIAENDGQNCPTYKEKS
jgi:hypothetical protein